jgi:hypothetical protein
LNLSLVSRYIRQEVSGFCSKKMGVFACRLSLVACRLSQKNLLKSLIFKAKMQKGGISRLFKPYIVQIAECRV